MNIEYSRSGETIEITVRDYSQAKIETRRCNGNDKKEYTKLLKYFRDKYGFEPMVKFEDDFKNDDEEEEDKDKLNWWT